MELSVSEDLIIGDQLNLSIPLQRSGSTGDVRTAACSVRDERDQALVIAFIDAQFQADATRFRPRHIVADGDPFRVLENLNHQRIIQSDGQIPGGIRTLVPAQIHDLIQLVEQTVKIRCRDGMVQRIAPLFGGDVGQDAGLIGHDALSVVQ